MTRQSAGPDAVALFVLVLALIGGADRLLACGFRALLDAAQPVWRIGPAALVDDTRNACPLILRH